MSEIPPARQRVSTTSIRASPICCAVVVATEYVPESSAAIVRTMAFLKPSETRRSYTSRHSPIEGCEVPGFTSGAAIFL